MVGSSKRGFGGLRLTRVYRSSQTRAGVLLASVRRRACLDSKSSILARQCLDERIQDDDGELAREWMDSSEGARF